MNGDRAQATTMKVAVGRVVKLAYRMIDGDGRLLEERTPENPYEYLHGHSQIVGPVERAIEGKTPGHRAEISVSPREGYGEYDQTLVAELPRENFPKTVDLKVGMKFNTEGPNAKPVVIRVIELDNDTVTVDGNHPLAGLDLVFELRILGVREATPEELAMGRTGPVSGTLPPGETDDSGGILH